MQANANVEREVAGGSFGQGIAGGSRSGRRPARFGAAIGLGMCALGLAGAILLSQPERAPTLARPAAGPATSVVVQPIADVRDAWFLPEGLGTSPTRPVGREARDTWYADAPAPRSGSSSDPVGRDSWYLDPQRGLAAVSGVTPSLAARDRWFEDPKPAAGGASAARDQWYLTR